jgi:hypothetical protein
MVTMNEKGALRRHLSKLGKKDGPKGGRARMAALTPEQRQELARKAAAARWCRKKRTKPRAGKPVERVRFQEEV